MSWLLNSIANSLTLDDDDDDAEEEVTAAASASASASAASATATATATGAGHDQPPSPRQGGGVKEDLSELSETLARKFRSVAFFLAPPPSISDRETETSSQPSDQKELDHIAGIRSDLTEIGGRFRAGISNLSSHKAVSEFTKIASNLLQLGAEEDETVSFEEYAERGVVGVSQEVVAFARNVAMHPETWLDFPLNDDDEQDEFDMSDAQQEHALAVEQLAPRLAALRIELCPGYMSEGCFWKIYFVLLHPRLSKHVADILSTPEIVKTRSMLTQEIHSRARSKDLKVDKPGGENAPVENANSSHEVHLSVPSNDQSESVPVEISTVDVSPTPSVEVDKHTVTSTEIPVIDKEVVEEVHQTHHEKPTAGTSKAVDQHEEDDTDDWLQEETLEVGGASRNSVPVGNDDDVSFSDLEDDDDDVK